MGILKACAFSKVQINCRFPKDLDDVRIKHCPECSHSGLSIQTGFLDQRVTNSASTVESFFTVL